MANKPTNTEGELSSIEQKIEELMKRKQEIVLQTRNKTLPSIIEKLEEIVKLVNKIVESEKSLPKQDKSLTEFTPAYEAALLALFGKKHIKSKGTGIVGKPMRKGSPVHNLIGLLLKDDKGKTLTEIEAALGIKTNELKTLVKAPKNLKNWKFAISETGQYSVTPKGKLAFDNAV